MPSFQVNIHVHPGDDETHEFTAKNKTTGAVIDLSSATGFAGTIRDEIGGTSLGSLTHNVGASDLVNGKVAMDIAKAVTAALPEISWYDVHYTLSGQDKTLCYGTITLDIPEQIST